MSDEQLHSLLCIQPTYISFLLRISINMDCPSALGKCMKYRHTHTNWFLHGNVHLVSNFVAVVVLCSCVSAVLSLYLHLTHDCVTAHIGDPFNTVHKIMYSKCPRLATIRTPQHILQYLPFARGSLRLSIAQAHV